MLSDFELHHPPRIFSSLAAARTSYAADRPKETKLYELQAAESFPMRIQITSTSVGWIEHEVQQGILQRVAASQPLRRK